MARRWQRMKGVLIGAIALCVSCGSVPDALARNSTAPAGTQAEAIGTVTVAQLPREAVDTLNLIAAGGPYPYEKDGVVFGNRERLLPPNRRGYYHEYTVPTPRSRNRGARRIVCGGPLKRTDNCYYSDDHYTSFNRIVE
ncbi:ribonuclease [bacterium M00.F.Ca.ET.228.01.1.1]|uniref:Guanine-specific ribonuclease N1 and T1 n=1 Tax=Burkholderia sp. (strain CCGE1003) TaxID=640512 RepID=E1T9F2_BURSG|nr:ribonuclease [Paraburkholderia phenoliruptrix]MBW9133266.1 ribonuclease [Paraburkholderia ginsengiterrae]TGP44197.1 ribonuclease [bacterium M00.F.Ca.ET.228.01.1.1]TGS01860.1 ribonuclease [bacterium M00.F.Ca.ET.191.01.1.1]TGU08535.1 ribonuclease [bacterium M00.F.Ca.ET.155.01.1.1]MBW0450081.1 ribonuclease [Paraburkholderia phenoliruptrix]